MCLNHPAQDRCELQRHSSRDKDQQEDAVFTVTAEEFGLSSQETIWMPPQPRWTARRSSPVTYRRMRSPAWKRRVNTVRLAATAGVYRTELPDSSRAGDEHGNAVPPSRTQRHCRSQQAALPRVLSITDAFMTYAKPTTKQMESSASLILLERVNRHRKHIAPADPDHRLREDRSHECRTCCR